MLICLINDSYGEKKTEYSDANPPEQHVFIGKYAKNSR